MHRRLSYVLQHFDGPSINCGNSCSVVMPASLWSGPCSADRFGIVFCFVFLFLFLLIISIISYIVQSFCLFTLLHYLCQFNRYSRDVIIVIKTIKLTLITVSRDGAVVRALSSHRCGSGSISWTQRNMWVEFVVGSLL